MISTILEYLELRFTTGQRGDYDQDQIAALLKGETVTPAAIERAIKTIDAGVARLMVGRRRPVDPWMVNGCVVLLCCLLGGCAADLPTAPSWTPPAQPLVVDAPRPATGDPFTITIAGESPAYTDHWWLNIAVTPNSGVASTVPTRVVIDCGTGTPTTLPGFVGTSGHTCVFGRPGDYTVRASAIAANGFTAQQTLRVSASTRPGPPEPAPIPPQPMYLTLYAREMSSTPTYAEWRFEASTSGRVVSWDFGDGHGSSRSSFNEQHIYGRAGQYTVTVRATPPGGGTEVSATRTITVVLCAMVDCP